MHERKILFITNQTYLSGAPRSFLYLIEWLNRMYPNIKTYILSLQSDNPTNNAFRDVSDVYYDLSNLNSEPNYSIKNRIRRKITQNKIISERDQLVRLISEEKFDLIYANTVVSLPVAQQIKQQSPNSKILLHVHEMATAIQQLLPDFEIRKQEVDFFIAASELVKEHLVHYFRCDGSIIKRVYECSDILLTNDPISIPHPTSKKVIMLGGAYWAKGDDVFLLVAKEVVKRDPSIHFYWLGKQSLERKTVNQGDIEKLDILENVHFLAHTNTPHDFLKAMDLFALTSRSDSFPLAAIEAGLLGVPIVCFEKASGIQEIIRLGGGEVVPYLDIQKMADAIIQLVTSDALRAKKSEEVKRLFQVCKPDVISQEIDSIITKLLN